MTANATVAYRRNDNDRIAAFPSLDGSQHASTLSATGTLTAGHGTAFQTLAFTFNGTGSDTSNGFAGNDVTEQAGIRGVSGNGFNDGLPTLIFTSGLTGLSGTTPSKRSTRSYQVSYNRMRFRGKHSMRLGGDYRSQTIDQQSDSRVPPTARSCSMGSTRVTARRSPAAVDSISPTSCLD